MDKVLTVIGRTFIGAGVLVFLFVAYQLWGTNWSEARQQDRLQAEAEQLFAEVSVAEDQTPTTTEAPVEGEDPPPPAPDPAPAPAPEVPQGSAVAIIEIPKIGVKKAVVAGTNVDDLKKGPGHYSETPLPGQSGNSAIAGHRTTYGAPFGDLDRLSPGDLIQVTTRQGTFRYLVSGQQIVAPDARYVLNATNDNRLTLTTCHPKFSAAQRLIVTAILDESPAPTTQPQPAPAPALEEIPDENATPAEDEADSGDEAAATTQDSAQALDIGLSGEGDVNKAPALWWGLGSALVLFLIWAAGHMWRRIPAYVVGTPIFLTVLFVFFENFARLLPANA